MSIKINKKKAAKAKESFLMHIGVDETLNTGVIINVNQIASIEIDGKDLVFTLANGKIYKCEHKAYIDRLLSPFILAESVR